MPHNPASGHMPFPSVGSDSALVAASAMADGVHALMATARGLIATGRSVDLTGLDQMFGRLCAACIDLPPEQGRTLRTRLEALRTGLDSLTALLGGAAPMTADEPAATGKAGGDAAMP